MKYSDSSKVALIVSITGLFVLIGIMIFVNYFEEYTLTFFHFLLFGLIIFFAIFIVTKTVVDQYIHERIRIIYKSIRKQKLEHSTTRKTQKQSISNVAEDVVAWSTDQQNEFEKMKALEKYRREYIGNVSHELKTPMFNIQGYVLTLLDGAVNDPEISMDYLIRTEKSVNRLISIIKDLEIISSLESSDFKIESSCFNIIALAIDVMEALEIKANKKGTRLYFAQEYNKPIIVEADRDKIEQVVTNLIDNSIKYGLKTGGETKISFFEVDDEVLMEITDNGYGIAKEDISRIFERFYRTDKARSRATGGTGLGLSIVKHIIEAHQQTINVRSSLDVGTTFAFSLKKH